MSESAQFNTERFPTTPTGEAQLPEKLALQVALLELGNLHGRLTKVQDEIEAEERARALASEASN
jgi:hypothetical protein